MMFDEKKIDLPVQFEVRGLFERFNYQIPLPTREKRVNFLSAPNGYGKSTALRLINDLASKRWGALSRGPFSLASISFESGRKIEVKRLGAVDTESQIEVSYYSGKGAEPVVSLIAPHMLVPDPEILPPWIEQINPDLYVDRRFDDRINLDQVLSRYGSAMSDINQKLQLDAALLESLDSMPVYYLDVNRLRGDLKDASRMPRRYRYRPESDSVTRVSELIGAEIRRSRVAYARASRNSERTFPQRILDELRSGKNEVSTESLKERYAKLKHEEQRFQKLCLADGEMEHLNQSQLEAMNDSTARVILGRYLEDIEARFSELEQAADRLIIFQSTINSMLEFKQVEFVYSSDGPQDESAGLMVEDDQGRDIPLTSLSSGEQHLVVMFGRILFEQRARNGALVLLDEPEISLHPGWQIGLSEALEKVAKTNRCRMILATHSPVMVARHADSEIPLLEMRVG